MLRLLRAQVHQINIIHKHDYSIVPIFRAAVRDLINKCIIITSALNDVVLKHLYFYYSNYFVMTNLVVLAVNTCCCPWLLLISEKWREVW